MDPLVHEGYSAAIEIDTDSGLLNGIVQNTRGTLHFAGRTLEELRSAFTDSIDENSDWCRADGVEPEKRYYRTISLRLAPELHRRVASRAAHEHKNLNAFVSGVLRKVA